MRHVLALAVLTSVAMPALPLGSQTAGGAEPFLRMAYYVPYDPASLASLRTHRDELDVAALHWASLREDGSLVDGQQAQVRQALQGFAGKALPNVVNQDFSQEVAHSLLTDSTVRQRALGELARLASRWDGLALDIEDIAPSDREAYTEFVRLVRSRIGPSKTLLVAVPARTRDTRTGWSAGFDYRGLAREADLVFLMAYAFRTRSSSVAGPTGPLPWITQSVEHALTEIPREKLVLGLPAYGYDWKLTQGRPEPPATSVVYRQAVELMERYGIQAEYDWLASGARLRYTDAEAQQHEVWFEDRRTFDQKLALVERFGLRGAGWWRLGGEDPGAWEALAVRADGGLFFAETGYSVRSPSFVDYFQHRGGVAYFGYPVSREFQLLGTRVQLFQRSAMQLGADGGVQLLNLMDAGLLPIQRANASTFPLADPQLQREAPSPSEPGYGSKVIEWIRAVVPDEWEGQKVGFRNAYFGVVDCETAYAGGECPAELLPLIALELWGLPTSRPARDPANSNFAYQRFQRGIMHYDASSGTTHGLLLADYFKSVLTGRGLPLDLAEDQKDSPFWDQHDPAAPSGLRRPWQVPATDLRGAFLDV